MKQFSFGLVLFLMSNSASAHTGMSSYDLEHIGLHISASVGITAVLIAIAYLFYKRTSKAKVQRIRVKK